MLDLVPITQAEAKRYVDRFHRHSKVPAGAIFQVGITADGETVCGVAIVGRPVNRVLDADPYTVELTRCCTDGTKNAPSKLYATCWRAARALGYRRLITYIRDDEPGTSLIAAGFRLVGETKGRDWDTPSRPRVPLQEELVDKQRWEIAA